jgi:hypothetical protein
MDAFNGSYILYILQGGVALTREGWDHLQIMSKYN